jgi:hypothetical protein
MKQVPTPLIQKRYRPKYGSYKYGKAREKRFPGVIVCLQASGREHGERLGSLFL